MLASPTQRMTGELVRHTRDAPCAVCSGFDTLPRRQGVRCFGFSTGPYVYCSREEHAGSLFPDHNSLCRHFTAALCNCGTDHSTGPATSPVSRNRAPVF